MRLVDGARRARASCATATSCGPRACSLGALGAISRGDAALRARLHDPPRRRAAAARRRAAPPRRAGRTRTTTGRRSSCRTRGAALTLTSERTDRAAAAAGTRGRVRARRAARERGARACSAARAGAFPSLIPALNRALAAADEPRRAPRREQPRVREHAARALHGDGVRRSRASTPPRRFTELIDHDFALGAHLNARDRKAVRRTVSGLVKILHPHGQVSRADLGGDFARWPSKAAAASRNSSRRWVPSSTTRRPSATSSTRRARSILLASPSRADATLSPPIHSRRGLSTPPSVSGDGTVGLYRVEVSLAVGDG